MRSDQVHVLVRDFVHDLHGEPEQAVAADATLDELGVDSMSLVDLLMKIEREFGVAIPDEDLPRIETVGDLVEVATNTAAAH